MRLLVLLLVCCFFSLVQSRPIYLVETIEPGTCGFSSVLNLHTPSSIHGEPLERRLKATVTCKSDDTLRFIINSLNSTRWTVPDVVVPYSASQSTNLTIVNPKVGQPFSFSVLHHGEVLFHFNSTLIMTEHYLELSGDLDESLTISGLGYRRNNLSLARDQKYGFWNRDEPGLPSERPAYSTHPLLLAAGPERSSRGIFFLNSNAMEVELTRNSFIFRSSGGIVDLFLYSGPSSNKVIQQHHSVVGFPVSLPLYALGWMQARWGWNTVDDVIKVIDDYDYDQIPLDVLFFDIDYMDKKYDFTVSKDNYPQSKLKPLVKQLRKRGIKIIPIVDPGIPVDQSFFGYTELLESTAFLTQETSLKPQEGEVWPGITIFPDFAHPGIQSYWTKMLSILFEQLPFDGLWIDMNEPASFITQEHPVKDFDWNNPPWKPDFSANMPLNWKTLNTGCNSYIGRFYNTHQLYSFYEAIITRNSLNQILNKKSLLVTRSSFAGSGRFTSTWLGDNAAIFDDLFYSIPGVLNYNMFGMPMVGPDVGGFLDSPTEELMARWSAASVGYPFARNHNAEGFPDQHPSMFVFTRKHMSKFIQARYRLVLYFNSLFIEASQSGGTVVRPLFFEFGDDPLAFEHEKTYMIGDSILCSPVLKQGISKHNLYLPSVSLWYDYFSGLSHDNGVVALDAPWDALFIFQRGGSILFALNPLLGENLDSTLNRGKVDIYVALNEKGEAVGRFLIDHEESLQSRPTVVSSSVTSSSLKLRSQRGHPLSRQYSVNIIRVSSVDTVSLVVVNGFRWDLWSLDDGVLHIDISLKEVSVVDDLDVYWV
ncbi:hypothetical protein P9112_007952 [Eukaryota sp. TZLM1-RC]